MKNTTLVYMECDGKYLMLNRNKKQNDENAGKWIGVGGKFEEGESPEECARREVLEETGLTAKSLRYRGIVTFVSNEWQGEYMHLFTCDDFSKTADKLGEQGGLSEQSSLSESDTLLQCDEGELAWIAKEEILSLPLWEGDRQFLKLLFENSPFFSMKLCYEGDRLIKTTCQIYD